MLILAHSGGDLLTKIFTNRIMNDLGFRRTLIGTTLMFAIFLAMCTTFSATTSYWWIGVVLFVGGVARSLQMTAMNALQFADIPRREDTSFCRRR